MNVYIAQSSTVKITMVFSNQSLNILLTVEINFYTNKQLHLLKTGKIKCDINSVVIPT